MISFENISSSVLHLWEMEMKSPKILNLPWPPPSCVLLVNLYLFFTTCVLLFVAVVVKVLTSRIHGPMLVPSAIRVNTMCIMDVSLCLLEVCWDSAGIAAARGICCDNPGAVSWFSFQTIPRPPAKMCIISASVLYVRCQCIVNDCCRAASLRVPYILGLQSVERFDWSNWVGALSQQRS